MSAQRRVLVVDDQCSVARSIASALTEGDFAVDLAHDGTEALASIEAHRYDAVVLGSHAAAAGRIGRVPLSERQSERQSESERRLIRDLR